MSSLARGSAVAVGMLAAAAAGIALTRPGWAALAGGVSGSRPHRRVGKHRRPPAARWQGLRTAAVRDGWRGWCAATARRMPGGIAAAGVSGALAGQARIGDCRGVPGPAARHDRIQDHEIHAGPTCCDQIHADQIHAGRTSSGPASSGLVSSGLVSSGLVSSGLVSSGPASSGPATSGPATSGPASSSPVPGLASNGPVHGGLAHSGIARRPVPVTATAA